ncbi:MAG: hypothetical protein ACT4PI_02645 [Actinomycetota bacterium]
MPDVPSDIHRPSASPGLGSIFGLATFGALVVYAGALPWAIASGSYDLWGGLLIAPVLALISLPLLRRLGRQDGDPWIRNLLGAALVVKLVGALIRYAVTSNILRAGDADAYHDAGRELAKEFRAWEFAGTAFQEHVPDWVGTPFIRLLTGFVYTVTGPTKLGGFVVFSWLGFWGLYLFYRAFRIAVPDGNHRLYAVLVFFLPSLVFWPSSIGKEAWMQLTIGVCAYAAACIFTQRRGGFPLLVLGLWGAAMVRPHMALIAIVAVGAGYVLRQPRRAASGVPGFGRLLGIVLLLVIGAAVVSQTESFFGVDASGTSAVDQVLERAETQSGQGASQFENARPSSPIEFPAAIVTVLFRPFLFEAGGSVTRLIASLEGTVVLLLFLLVPRRLLAIPRQMVRMPYAAFATTFSLLFIYGFSAVGNFGILVRQRTQVFPLLLVLAALPMGKGTNPESATTASAAPTSPTKPANARTQRLAHSRRPRAL